MGADTQLIDGILKDYYEDFVADQVNDRNPLKDLFRTESKGFSGRETIYTAHVSRNVSPMFVGEDSAFADAGVQGHVQVRVGQKKLMARVRMTYEAMKDSMSSEGAFKSARRDEMDSLIKDIARREEYALATDGRGILALVQNGANSITQTLDAPGGIAHASFGNRFIQPGMYIGFVNPATGLLRSSAVRKVVSVSAAGATIVIDSTFSSTTDDYVVQVANSAVSDILDTSYEQAFWGLMALVDDGTYRDNYFGVSRTTWPVYKSYVKAATGALSIDLLQQSADVVDQKLGGQIDVLVMHHSTRRLYLQLTESDRRYSGADLRKPDAGTVAFQQGDISMGEVPIKCIRDFPLDVIMLLDKKNSGFVKYESEKGKWVDEDGSVLVRVGTGSTGRDSFEAWYRVRKQYHCKFPGKSARLDGVTGQSLIVARGE